MSGTAPRTDQGPCDERACVRPYGHRGEHIIRRCARDGCDNPTRNADERYCTRHETRDTYERYVNPDGSPALRRLHLDAPTTDEEPEPEPDRRPWMLRHI